MVSNTEYRKSVSCYYPIHVWCDYNETMPCCQYSHLLSQWNSEREK